MTLFARTVLVATLLCLPLSAFGWPLRSGPARVAKDGKVTVAGTPVGKLRLPPGPHSLSHAFHTVAGHRVLHLRLRGKDQRAAEMVLTPPPAPRAIFAGSTGPQGVDGEWSQLLRVSAEGILLFQRREGVARCDGEPVYLFPRMYDFAAGRFRPVASVPRLEGVPTLTAVRNPPGMPAGPPLNTFRLVAASAQLGDEGQAISLAGPSEAEDGRPDTAWIEGLGGDGRGEFLTASAEPSPYRLKAVSIIPGLAASPKTFREANRLKSALLLLSPTRRYRVVFPQDPAAQAGKFRQPHPGAPKARGPEFQEPFWIVLPEPAATECATLVVASVYPGTLARPPRSGGRTAIAELRFYTELEFGGGIAQVLKDLGASNKERGDNAVRILARMGRQGVELAHKHLSDQASPALVERVLAVLLRSRLPEAAAPLAGLLPRIKAARRSEALEALAALGRDVAVPPLLPLLDTKDLSLRADVARTLGRLGGTEARQALLGRAGQGPETLRAAVVAGLTGLRTPEDLEAVVAAAEKATDPRRRADLLLAAGRMAPQAAHQAAARVAALWTPTGDFEVRYRILAAVGRLDPAGQLQLLLRAARDPEPVLRWLATEQIRRVPSGTASTALRRSLVDQDPRVRATAALALARRPRSRDISLDLARRLKQERWPIVGRALAEALGHHCTPEGLAVLRKTMHSGPRGVDVRALLSIVSCNPAGLSIELLALAGSTSWRPPLRQRALQLMTPAMIRRHTSQLVQLFHKLRRRAVNSDEEEALAAAAATTLGRSDRGEAAEALADALALDPHESIRAAAALALGRPCNRPTAPTLKRAARDDASAVVRGAAKRTLRRCKF